MLAWKLKVLTGFKGLLASSVKQSAGEMDAGEMVVLHELIRTNKLDELLPAYDIFVKAKKVKKDALNGLAEIGSWTCQYSQVQFWAGLSDSQAELLAEILKDTKAKPLFVDAVKKLYSGYVYHA